MTNIIPVVGIVYKSKDGNWRGFCYPYDVTCNADTKEEAMHILDELIATYEECLQKYNYPKHLVEKKLSDKEDQIMFKKIWPQVSEKMAEHLKAANPIKYSDYLSQDRTFNAGQSVISYSHRSLPVAA